MQNHNGRPLHGYQQTAAQWALDRLYARDQRGAALFLDPGLGKTRTSLTVIDELLMLGEVRRVLVVAPLRPLYSVWPSEIKEWGFNLSYSIMHQKHNQAMGANCQLELVNPEGLVKLEDLGGRWDLVVIDESTKFKTWGTQRYKFLRKILKRTPKRLILSGTPAANSLADLHAQMFICDDGEALGRTVTFFRDTYMMRGGYEGKQFVIRPELKNTLLEKIAPLCLRMDAESYLDMPELVFNDIWVDLPPEAMKQYRKLKRELYVQLQTGDIMCGSAAAAYGKCKQFANGTVYNTDEQTAVRSSHWAHDEKIKALVDLHEELAGKPMLTGYQVTQDLTRLLDYKTKGGSKPFSKWSIINGGTNGRQTDEICDRWNQGTIPGILAQTQAISHGMNMQRACNDVTWFGLCDSPETYDQFIRRVYRQGVKGNQVRVHRLLTRGTVDEPMLARITSKGQTQAEFLEALKSHARG